jgi:type IV pilus assembly protein PilN
VIRINLLPREERARRRTMPTIKIPALGGVFVPFIVLGAVASGIVATSTFQGREIAQLETEIAQLRRESESYKPQLEKIRQITQKRQEVGNRLDIIAKLDQERYYRVKLMDEVSRAVPENVWLTKLEEQGGRKFALEGVTFSNFLVARFMKQLEATPHWEGVELGVAQQGKIDGFDVVQFSLVSGTQP